ncbi:hypothetical protein FHS89_002150 [Rubricella aquisinus]|uniref:Uncharacterized protein n=1 Tax=Rubricella aquisinus TaxID=2028108 RepID=A0A840X079_9RHOB|nr:hypothetical protein [Rubricella aquisinus]MBB5516124.1 hypothetical protein [Rubricella aquisinus]
MKQPRQVTVNCSGRVCVLRGFSNPKPMIDLFARVARVAERKGQDLTPEGVAAVLAKRRILGIKVTGTPERIVMEKSTRQTNMLRPREEAEKRMEAARKLIEERARAHPPSPDLSLFNPLMSLSPLGYVSGTRPEVDLSKLDAFEWSTIDTPTITPFAAPDVVAETPDSDDDFVMKTDIPAPGQAKAAAPFDAPHDALSDALEAAMSGQIVEEKQMSEPSLSLSLADYAAPRRPKTLEQALEIAAAYRRFIHGEQVFARRDVLLDVDDIAIDGAPFPPDVKLRAFNALVEQGGSLIRKDRGLFTLGKSLEMRYGR